MTWISSIPINASNILDMLPEAYVRLDAEFRYTLVNCAAEQVLRRNRADLLGRTLWEIYPALIGTPFEQNYRRAMAERAQVSFEDYYAPWQRWYSITASPDPTGGIIIHFADVTERKRVEVALRESEEKHRILLEESSDPIFSFTPEGRYTYVNKAFAQGVAKAVEEIIGKTIWDVFEKEEADKRFAVLSQVFRKGEEKVIEVRVPRRDGDRFYVTTITPIKDALGHVTSAICSSKDITERKRAEQALRESEKEKREILDSIGDAFFSLDDNLVIRHFNPAAERMLNRKAEDVVGQRLFDAFPEARGSIFEQNYTYCLRTKSSMCFETAFTTAPYVNWYDVRVYPEKHGIAVFFQVITERKRAEEEREKLQEQLAQAQKMESIGRLAGGVAHDFNNLLTVINGYSDMTLNRTHPGDPRYQSLQEVLRAGERAAGLVRQLLAFSRKQVLQPEVLDLNVAVNEMEKMLGRLMGEDIEVLVKMDLSIPPILADRHQIEQVIMNLAVNARDAMPDGGTLTIETRQPPPGTCIELIVRDTGLGMDEHTLQHLFEPFFTTKGVGKGTGLGLSTVQGIVAQSGGQIRVESEMGKGSAFHISLPIAERAAGPNPVAKPEVGGGAETVLLVEDQDEVRRFVASILRSYGYRVLDTGDTDEALRICTSETIDLLLTDVVMPKLSGGELARRVRLFAPELKTLFISGYAEETHERKWESLAGAQFLQKPFAPRILAAKVREVLDGH